jgi:hypothetical protein
VIRSPKQGISIRKRSVLSTQFVKCTALLHVLKHHQFPNTTTNQYKQKKNKFSHRPNRPKRSHVSHILLFNGCRGSHPG